ncbi:MAG: ADP-ribosylation factor-like protein [Candidatus Hodarchaeota archaeon]
MSTPKSGIVQLAVIGEADAGKTTLIARLVSGDFIDTSITAGFDVETWQVSLDESTAIKASLFEFGTQDHFRFFQAAHITGAKIALIVFDSSSFGSLKAIDEYIGMISNIPRERKLLVGTKIDVCEKIDYNEIQEVASRHGIEYLLVSAKEGTNIGTLVLRLKEMIQSM